MSVVGIAAEAPGSPRATFELGQHVITRVYKVVSDNINDGPMTIGAAIGLPRMFQAYSYGHEFHPYCRVREIDPQRLTQGGNGPYWWEVTVTYRTPEQKGGARGEAGGRGDGQGGGGDGGGTYEENDSQFENPLLAIPEISTHFENYKQAIYACYDTSTTPGKFKAPQASTGEIFVPPAEMDASRLILQISRNEDLLSPALLTAVTYQDKVNSDSFWGSAPGTCKVMGITIERQTKQLPTGIQYPYQKVTYTFAFKATWDLLLLDQGTYYNDDVGGFPPQTRKVRFQSDDGNPINGLLNGKGGKLADNSNPVFLSLRPYDRLPFGALNLPQSFQHVC